MRLALIPITIASLAFSALAAFNHSEIKWQSVSSKNFTFHYYDKTEPVLYAAAKIAEEIYTSLSPLYRYHPYHKINISLIEVDDESNGFASWLDGSIQIMVPDLRFDLRGNTIWLRNVITHELAHILSLEQKRSLQVLDISLFASYTTPAESFSFSAAKPMITMYPSWLAEGIAQLEAATAGNDCWDSRRDMVLRSAILEGGALSLDEMGHFNHDSRGNELVYNQGFSLTRHIEKRIGRDALHALILQANEEAMDFPARFKDRTGTSLAAIYREWLEEKRAQYNRQVPANPTPYSTLWASYDYSVRPASSPDGTMIAFLSNDRDDSRRTDCIVKSASGTDIIRRIPWAHTKCEFSPSSDIIYYLKSRTANRDGSFLNDLYSCAIRTGKEERLTRDARIYDFTVTPAGDALICVRYRGGGAYSIDRLNLTDGTFDPLMNSPAGESFINVACDPNNPTHFVYSQLVNGTSRLLISTTDHNVATMITLPQGSAESPFWGKNGRIYFNADFDGIFNIYSVNPDGSDLLRHSFAKGGFFQPVAFGNNKILCSRYGQSGFTITLLDPISEPYTNVPYSSECSFEKLPMAQHQNDVPKGIPYSGSFLRPFYSLFAGYDAVTDKTMFLQNLTVPTEYSTGTNLSAGVVRYQSDALQKKLRMFGLAGALQSAPDGDSVALSSFKRAHQFQPINASRGGVYTKDIFSPSSDRLKSRLSGSSLTRSDPFSLKNVISKATGDTGSSSAMQIVPTWEPFFLYQNSSKRATIRFEMDVPVILVYPYSVMTNVNAQWQLTRDLFFQAGINSTLYTIGMFINNGDPVLQYLLPLNLSWQTNGYYNHNYGYNFANTGVLSLMVAPARIGFTSHFVDSNLDTIKGGLMDATIYEASGFYSFGLTKFSALQFHANLLLERYKEFPVYDNQDLLSGLSTLYTSGQAGADLVLPLFRDINKTFLNYWDALYTSIGYRLMLRANQSFFDKPMGPLFSDALESASDRPRTLWADHAISARITLGSYASYSYFNQLQLNATYYVLNKSGSMSFGFGL